MGRDGSLTRRPMGHLGVGGVKVGTHLAEVLEHLCMSEQSAMPESRHTHMHARISCVS